MSARRFEPPEVAEVKGRLVMADVLAAAVRDRQRVPDGARTIPIDRDTVRLDSQICRRAAELARRSRLPHNQARPIFVREVVAALARQLADRIGADVRGGPSLLGAADLDEIRRDLRGEPAIQAALDELWPILTPQQLLTDLYASDNRLASAAPQLPAAARDLLRRDPGGGWTPADVPLLDEAAELLGTDDRTARAVADQERRLRTAEAQGVLDILAGSAAHELDDLDAWGDHEVLTATDLLDAARLAQRQEERLDGTVAERAAADRTWAFGHVIVDEAQELSELAWRMLMRRCPSRSMTVVGDVDQTGDLAGTSSWRRVLEPYAGDRWRLERLTVNYRTPAEIMDVATELFAGESPPRSVRETGVPPWRQEAPAAELPDLLAKVAAEEAAHVGDGRLAVIVPASRLADLGRVVVEAVPGTTVGDDPNLEHTTVVLSVRQAKGLEFDSVVVVEPARIMADSPRGRNDLYVALTRATQRLGIVHTDPLPDALARLRTR